MMDPLIPKFSAYELDYTADIQHKMRVPDKLSYDSEKSLQGDEDAGSLRNYAVADLVLDSTKPNYRSPGYSPDLLSNADVRGVSMASASASALACESKAAATASAYTSSSPNLYQPAYKPSLPSDSEKSVKRLELQITQLQRRVSSLEFQQNLVGTGLTLYIAFKILRWLLRALQ
ncbi:hypothetical protein D915_003441 [Fasciola hepatica]|uniref:Mff-like domain-containing protein n=1 Tax=Fasciola hepatica TaxID=6192 RepID=A0A4E0R8H0_FASHE|nr:hypothetical protein D915_003441 [Fasciola hepatica]